MNYYFSAPSPGIELVYTDLKLMVKDIQPTSAFIEWRVFSFNEKPLIDGVQIRLCTPSCAPAGKKIINFQFHEKKAEVKSKPPSNTTVAIHLIVNIF